MAGKAISMMKYIRSENLMVSCSCFQFNLFVLVLIFGFLFVDQNVKIKTIPSLMHDKVIIVDGTTVITGKKAQY